LNKFNLGCVDETMNCADLASTFYKSSVSVLRPINLFIYHKLTQFKSTGRHASPANENQGGAKKDSLAYIYWMHSIGCIGSPIR